MSFMNLHSHTHTGSNLRLRDSINKSDELILYAHELGHKGIAITDHESITAHLECLEYYNSVKDKEEWKDFKLALGNEIYLCADSCTPDNKGNNVYPHFLLIALDAIGHQGIRELSTIAWVDNCFMDVMNRVPTYYRNLEDKITEYKGHIIGSSACIGSPIARRLLYYKENNTKNIWEECVQWVNYMVDLFGVGYFFLELQPGETEEQIWVNNHLVRLAEETNTPYIITTDAHYLKKEDRLFHKTFLNASDGDRETDQFYQTTYMMSEDEIHSYMDKYLGYDKVQSGIDNTMLIYDKVTYYDLKKDLHIPYMPLHPQEPSEELYKKYVEKVPNLKDIYNSSIKSDRDLCAKILNDMERDPYYRTDEAYAKIDEALDYNWRSSEKNKVHWSAYLLQEADYIDICWKVGSIVCPGRGSGVGYCLLNMLDIVQVNPLRETTKTYPWRFQMPDRQSILDIDVDINPKFRDAIIEKMKEIYGSDKVSKVLTLQTEKAKSAILTAARGLGISNDKASYIASLVVFDRGNPRSLYTMYYGNDEYAPVSEFVKEMNANPQLWEMAQKIEGLVCGVGSHAGGVIIADEPLTNSTALMRTNSGDIITQYDLHKCEDVSLIKIDLLATDAIWKIQETLNLLLKAGKIEWQGDLRSTYEKYIGIYTLERNNLEMWKMLWDHKVLSFFQMEKESGKAALALVKPKSVDDLATLNSVIRLMPQEKGAETPLNKYARFHENIEYWYDEMRDAGLTEEEMNILKGILGVSYGICEAQEYLVILMQHPAIAGFPISWGDKLRKAVAKKKPKDFMALEEEYYKNAEEKGLSRNLINYVWKTLVSTQRGYGFNKSHTLAYSLIGLQELNLNWKWNPIYWQTANLIVDSGSGDEETNDSTKYGKLGVAISRIQKECVTIANPDINTAEFGFVPDEDNNRIVCGLKSICSINTELAQEIIKHRPYTSFEDFCERMCDTKIVKPSQMIMLIKAGCFLKLDDADRAKTMKKYLSKYKFKAAERLTLSQLSKIKELDILPESLDLSLRVLKFKDYVLHPDGFVENVVDEKKKVPKCGYHDRLFVLDKTAQEFFTENFSEDCVERVDKNGYYVVSEKKFNKAVDEFVQPLKEWFALDSTLNLYNEKTFRAIWEENASGTEPKWSMQALTYYDGEHELEHTNEEKYGIVNFFDLPEEPEAYEHYIKYIDGQPKEMPKFKITRVAGTVLNADSNHHTVGLLTKYGVVNLKFYKESYAAYNRRTTAPDGKGGKTIIDESWFKRGTLLAVVGYRRGDQFVVRNYADTVFHHTVNKITSVNTDGSIELQIERSKA